MAPAKKTATLRIAAQMKKPAAAGKSKSKPQVAVRSKPKALVKKTSKPKPRKGESSIQAIEKPHAVLKGIKGYVVNLERRPDRWKRVCAMLKTELKWLAFEQFPASDGTKHPIPEVEVVSNWNTCKNALFADYYEWVYDDPGNPMHGKQWKWACDVEDDDGTWCFTEHGDDAWCYTDHAAGEIGIRTGEIVNKFSGEKFYLRLQYASEYISPGMVQRMSGGERGCAHSHLRLWRLAAEREDPTLVLEDDVNICFDRNNNLGKMNGAIFTKRLVAAVKHAPCGWDVIYLSWSGWRGGHLKLATDWWKQHASVENPKAMKFVRSAEYVWTTAAYVITRQGAQKLLARGTVDQPVDNFMAWEASEGRLMSYVAVDAGDDDDTWAGGIADQLDFAGDSDIQKSDGGHQGDDEKEFAVGSAWESHGADETWESHREDRKWDNHGDEEKWGNHGDDEKWKNHGDDEEGGDHGNDEKWENHDDDDMCGNSGHDGRWKSQDNDTQDCAASEMAW